MEPTPLGGWRVTRGAAHLNRYADNLMRERVHILGASGSGTSSLGRTLAARHGLSFFDADDFFWQPSDPPYQHPRDALERQLLLTKALSGATGWVLAGSISHWGDAVVPFIDLAVFITAPTDVRLARLRLRETERFGARLLEGGDMYEQHRAFIGWASRYDDGPAPMRSRALHEAWLAELACPVVRVDGSLSLEELCVQISEAMAA